MSNVQLEYSANDMAHLCNEAKGNFEVLATLIEQVVNGIQKDKKYLEGLEVSISLETPLHLAQAALQLTKFNMRNFTSYADCYERAENELVNEGRMEDNSHG